MNNNRISFVTIALKEIQPTKKVTIEQFDHNIINNSEIKDLFNIVKIETQTKRNHIHLITFTVNTKYDKISSYTFEITLKRFTQNFQKLFGIHPSGEISFGWINGYTVKYILPGDGSIEIWPGVTTYPKMFDKL